MLRHPAAGELLGFTVPACGQIRDTGLACLPSLQKDLNHRKRETRFALVGAAAWLACGSAQV